MVMRDDRFQSPKPSFIQPKDIAKVLVPPRKRFEETATPISKQDDDQLVSRLLKQAKAMSQKIINEFPDTSKTEKKIDVSKVRFCEAHILDNKRFLEITRTLKITDKGAMQLLIANGGEEYLTQGFLPAQAFDLLRKDKLNALGKIPDKSFDKRPKMGEVKTFTPGVLTAKERAAKIGMYLVSNAKKDEEQQ